MKSLVLGLLAFSAIAASAATARLGSTVLSADESSATIDVRNASAQDSVTLSVKGETISVGEVRVVFRTGGGFGKYVSAKFKVNKVLAAGNAIALDLPANGLPIRRIEIEARGAGFNRDAYITATGSN